MSKVIPFTGITTLDMDPDVILEANKREFRGGVVLIGWDENDEERFLSAP